MNIEIKLYKEGVRWASGGIPLNVAPYKGGEYMTNLRPDAGRSNALYRVRVVPVERLFPGWNEARVTLEIEGMAMDYPGFKPVSWYDHEETDWPSGLVRFPDTEWDSPNPSNLSGHPIVWTLAFRSVK